MQTLVRLRNLLLLVAVAAVVVAIPLSERLQFDQRLESFFADDHPDIQLLHRSQQEFGANEFVIVAWSEQALLQLTPDQPHTLTELLADKRWKPDLTETATTAVEEMAAALNEIPGVDGEQTQNLVRLLSRAPRIRNVRRAMLRLFRGTLIGEDASTTSVVLTLLPEADAPVSRAETLRQIRAVAQRLQPNCAVAGEPVQIHDMFRLVEEDSHVLFLASLVILAVVLLVLFRGVRWMLGAVGLVLGVVLCTRAILVLAGAELSMVGSMLNSLVTVIGIATCMHVVVHYRDLRLARRTDGQKDDAPAAAVETLQEMLAPVFWTCVTTAVGFSALLVSQITPVRSFSLMMTLATAVIVLACVLLLPALLASGRSLKPPALAPLEHWLDHILATVARWQEHFPRRTALVFFVITAACVPGVLMMTIETDFSRNFRESSTIVQSLKFIESRLGGVGTWEVAFDTPEELDDRFLKDVIQLTDELTQVGDDESPVQVLSLAEVANIPPRVRGPRWMLQRMTRRFPQTVAAMHNDDANRMRIVLRSHEQQSAESKARQIADVRQLVQEFTPAGGTGRGRTDPTASGMFVLLTEIIQSLLQDQFRSFLWASAGIFLCATIAFRSIRIGLISLLPNMFPVALLLGMLGWTGIPVNIGTAMIASVSMGLTVDSTIHYIFAFERARRHNSVSGALRQAHAGAGRAVVFAHLALIAGFAVLTASRFIPLVYFGGLMSLSMFCGVFGDLILLPLLLRWTTPEKA